MNSNIKISSPEKGDGIQMINVFYKTWLETYPNSEIGITKEDIEESFKDSFSDANIQKIEKSIIDPIIDEYRLVVKDGGAIIGVGTIRFLNDQNLLKTLYVLPLYQGKGIGTMLWNELSKKLDKNKGTFVHVATYTKKAINFYKKIGFIETGKTFNEERFRMPLSGVYLPEIEMKLVEKNLNLKIDKTPIF